MKIRLKTLIILFFISTVAWSQDDLRGDITWVTNTDSGRQKASLVVMNNSDVGIVCNNVAFVAEVEDPNLYMQTGELVLYIDNMFLYPDVQKRNFKNEYFEGEMLNLNDGNEKQLIIRKTELDLSESSCQKASFIDYCKYAKKDNFELLSLALLGKKFKRHSCSKLFSRLEFTMWLNLKETKITDFRFAQYLLSLNRIKVHETYRDRSDYLYIQDRFKVRGEDSQDNSLNNISYQKFVELLEIDEEKIFNKFKFK